MVGMVDLDELVVAGFSVGPGARMVQDVIGRALGGGRPRRQNGQVVGVVALCCHQGRGGGYAVSGDSGAWSRIGFPSGKGSGSGRRPGERVAGVGIQLQRRGSPDCMSHLRGLGDERR